MKKLLYIVFVLLVVFHTNLVAQVSVTCGTSLNQTYCYGNNDVTTFLYESSDGVSPLLLAFNSGGIESCCDDIFLYDGVDNTAPLLYSGNNGGDLSGITVTSTGKNLFLVVDSDISVSCQSGSGCCPTPWDWDVDCLNCMPVQATATVIDGCPGGFTVDVNITSLGDATSVAVTDGTTVLQGGITTTGVITVGPFINNTPIDIIVEHDTDPICNEAILTLENSTFCASLDVVTCGTSFNRTYCYGDNDVGSFLYESGDGVSPLLLVFNSGGIESCCDDILIYDGVDNTAPLLYSGNNGGDLSGITVTSTGKNLFIEIDSDGSVSCQSGSGCCPTPWDWDVDSLTCMPIQATTVVVQDCINGFTVDVNITSLGDAASVAVTDGNTVLQGGITSTGIITVGPFTNNTPVDIIVEHDVEAICNVTFVNQVNTVICPVNLSITCGQAPLSQTYCYINNDPATWLYTASNSSATLTLSFSAGYLESCCDDLLVYDGTSASAPVLYDSNNASTIAGVTFTSTGASVFMDVQTDGSVSCSGGSGAAWDWTVECIGGCDYPVATATYDCATDEVVLNVSNEGLPLGSYTATLDGTGTGQTINTSGNYTFSGLTSDQSYNIFMEDATGCTTMIPYIFGACNLPYTPEVGCTSMWPAGDFESGDANWNENKAVGGGAGVTVATTLIEITLPLAGTKSVHFGGFGGTSPVGAVAPFISTLEEAFFGTSGKAYTLRFWLIADACDSVNDVFEISIDGNFIYGISGGDPTCGDQKWREIEIDLSAYADGAIHTVTFQLVENETNGVTTSIFIDEMVMEECTPIVCPANYLIPQAVSPGTPAYNGGFVSTDVWDFETDGTIVSIQTITSSETADYDSATSIELGALNGTIFGFEVQLGATFHAFIDGCNGTGGTVNPLVEEESTTALSKDEEEGTTILDLEK